MDKRLAKAERTINMYYQRPARSNPAAAAPFGAALRK